MTSTTSYPSVSDALRETVPVVDVVPVAGPPVIFIVAPWLLLVLMLIGPFALMATLAVALVAVAAVLALAGAVAVGLVVGPFLLARRLSHVRLGHPLRAAAAQLAALTQIRHHQEKLS